VTLLDGNPQGCACTSACEFPCWQRVGLTNQRCCAGCAPVEAGWRPQDASAAFVDSLAQLDAREQRIGLPPLAHQELSWQTLVGEVMTRLHSALDGSSTAPDRRLVEDAGAWMLVLWQKVMDAEVVSVTSGDPEDTP
jgi:hypothetical protein